MTIGILPNVNFVCLNRVLNSAMSACFPTERLRNNRTESRKRVVTKVKWLWVKDVRQLGYVSQETEPTESSPIFTEGHKSLGTKSTSTIHRSYAASWKHREQKGPSLGKIQVKLPHQRSPYGVNFEDRSQEETARQERCARCKAWTPARHIYKLKEKDKTTFCSLTECRPHPPFKKPGEREFVVDSGSKYANGQQERT